MAFAPIFQRMDIVEAPAARQRRFADENEAIAARLEEREAGRELAPFFATARENEIGHEICADATCGTCHHSYMDHYGVCLKPDCLLCREQDRLPSPRRRDGVRTRGRGHARGLRQGRNRSRHQHAHDRTLVATARSAEGGPSTMPDLVPLRPHALESRVAENASERSANDARDGFGAPS